ncbi:hypothetical protein [Streptomyces sp. LNU-CPARS28]|uniref:hypothetical protein n=1 Tax=Streptomyces sp. LNU-CPARS28 TaxID=3137371 RepID=UPI003136CB15
MTFPVLSALGAGLSVIGIIGLFTTVLANHHACGIIAVANALYAVENIREGDHLWAVFDTAVCAYFAWCWWHGGGGDGTRRRLRSWARRFRGVRRTAPAGSAS